MHFWINKSSQQGWRQGHICALRRPIPPAVVAAYYKRHNQGNHLRGYYPSSMVTPVRRFQSLDSVVNNGLRHGRSQQYHHPVRSSGNHSQSAHCNATTPVSLERSVERQIDPLEDIGEIPRISSKCKCLVYMFFIMVIMVAVTNYFVYGYPFVMGEITFIVVSLISGTLLLIVGAYFLVIKDLWQERRSIQHRQQRPADFTQQNQQPQVVVEEAPPTLPTSTEDPSEIPPPPYHIAILLSPQSDLDSIEVIQDQSPPPSYEKAVT